MADLARRRRAHGVVRRLALGLVVLGAAVLLGLAFAVSAGAQGPSPSPSSSGSQGASTSTSPSPTTSDTAASASQFPPVNPPAVPSGPASAPVAAPAAPSPIAHPGDGTSNTCFTCHDKVDPKQRTIAEQWKASVHGKAGVGCADCHGGDPRSDEMGVAMAKGAGFIGTPDRATTVGICASCHSDPARMRQYGIPTDQYAQYVSSVHGQRLLTAHDTRVATCIDCHGTHDIKKASDPTAKVSPLNVPALCASCHANAKLMQPYGIPTDQYAVYKNSIHGQLLLVQQDVRAPTCASCHGSHAAKPPTDAEVVGVCGKCHTATQALFAESPHSRLVVGPRCWTCHGTHDVTQPGLQLFFHPGGAQFDCSICHDPTDRSLRLETTKFAKESDRRCDTCHHSGSQIYTQIKGIYDALKSASDAYATTEARIVEARSVGMITADAEVALTQAKTSLLKAQAAVHTTKLATIGALTDDVKAKSGDALRMADAKLDQSDFRRQAMVVVVLLIGFNVAGLFGLRRRLRRPG